MEEKGIGCQNGAVDPASLLVFLILGTALTGFGLLNLKMFLVGFGKTEGVS